jgi:hypothetical protein
MAEGVLGFSAMSVLVKLVGTNIPANEIVIARTGVTFILSSIGRWRSGLGLHPVLGGACLLLCTTSFVFSFSRTLSLVVLLGLLGVAGFFARREWLRVGLLLLAVLKLIGIGRKVERGEANTRIARNVETRNEVDRSVARVPDPADELRRNWSRD